MRSAAQATTGKGARLARRPRPSRAPATGEARILRGRQIADVPWPYDMGGQANLVSCSSSRSTARRIHDETERSSALAASRILASVWGGNLTGTSSESFGFRDRAGPCGVWLSGPA